MFSVLPESTRQSDRQHAVALASFHRSLAELCKARVPLPKALEIVGREAGHGPLRKAIADLARDVEGGTPLAEAYSRRQGVFRPSTELCSRRA